MCQGSGYKLGFVELDKFGLKPGSVAYKLCAGHSSLFILSYFLLLHGLNKISIKGFGMQEVIRNSR